MTEFQRFFSQFMYTGEAIAALVSIIYFNREKKLHWKLFALYLIAIFLCESSVKWAEEALRIDRIIFYNYFVMPLQFIFFYWLYAVKSLKKPKLFYIFSLLYFAAFIPQLSIFVERKVVYAPNYTLGCIFLMVLIVMEYYKQVNSTEILKFRTNRMFYINLGNTLFYIGTLPFMTFMSLLWEYRDIWDLYFAYFQISGAIMYLLFASAFIWGKQN